MLFRLCWLRRRDDRRRRRFRLFRRGLLLLGGHRQGEKKDHQQSFHDWRVYARTQDSGLSPTHPQSSEAQSVVLVSVPQVLQYSCSVLSLSPQSSVLSPRSTLQSPFPKGASVWLTCRQNSPASDSRIRFCSRRRRRPSRTATSCERSTPAGPVW